MFANVFFDLDGTLTDPFEGITKSVAYALARFGITVSDRRTLAPFIGPPLTDSFMSMFGFDQKTAFSAVKAYREYFEVTGKFENEVYPDIPEVLEALKSRGKKLFVATSKPEIFAKQIIEHFDLDKYIDGVYGATLDGSRVKKADVIAYALKKTGATAATAVMVGDRIHDIDGAIANGLPSIAVLYGYGDREEFGDKPTRFAVTPPELLDIIT